jgi:hypothetical protein
MTESILVVEDGTSSTLVMVPLAMAFAAAVAVSSLGWVMASSSL